MFDWFKRKEKLVILEINKEVGRLPELTDDLKSSLAALAHSPAFQYLLKRMESEKATLENYLKTGFTLSEQQLHHLQAGVHYLSYLEREVSRLTAQPRPVPQEPAPSELEAFQRAMASIETIQ